MRALEQVHHIAQMPEDGGTDSRTPVLVVPSPVVRDASVERAYRGGAGTGIGEQGQDLVDVSTWDVAQASSGLPKQFSGCDAQRGRAHETQLLGRGIEELAQKLRIGS